MATLSNIFYPLFHLSPASHFKIAATPKSIKDRGKGSEEGAKERVANN
jgi:hypothetical protein